MHGIAEFIVKVADLVEAEGRSARSALRADVRDFKESASHFALGLVAAVAGGTLAVIGLILWLAAVYLAVAEVSSPAWGAFAAGALALGVAGGAIALYRKLVKQ